MHELKRRWAAYWPGADVEAMARDVAVRVDAAVNAWGLRELTPLPGGHVAVVWAAGDVVLKVNPRGHLDDEQLAAEGTALAFRTPTGAVPRLAGRRDGGFTLLLERLVPGRPLDADDLAWEERLDVLGALAGRLHAAGPAPASIPHLGGAYARDWRRVLGDSPLLAAADDDVLLHADLHGGNALRHGAEVTSADARRRARVDPVALTAAASRSAR